MSSYFDPVHGWVTPADDVESETHGSLKDILTTLKKIESSGVIAPDDFYSAVERILYRYSVFIQHGIREDFGKHKGVSWYLVELGDGRDVVSYQDGAGHEWCELCLADEIPMWLLIGLLRRIERRKPLGDQEADDVIKSVKALDDEFNNAKAEKGADVGGLNTISYSSYLRRRGLNDE